MTLPQYNSSVDRYLKYCGLKICRSLYSPVGVFLFVSSCTLWKQEWECLQIFLIQISLFARWGSVTWDLFVLTITLCLLPVRYVRSGYGQEEGIGCDKCLACSYWVDCSNDTLRCFVRHLSRIVIRHYGCETWSLTLREERKLRVFENMVLRRLFRPRRDEVTGEWRRLHIEELIDLYSSPNIVRVIKSRRMRWAGHVARMGEERGVYRVLVGKP